MNLRLESSPVILVRSVDVIMHLLYVSYQVGHAGSLERQDFVLLQQA